MSPTQKLHSKALTSHIRFAADCRNWVVYNSIQDIMYVTQLDQLVPRRNHPQGDGKRAELALTEPEAELLVAPLCLNCKVSRSRQELPSERF